MNSKLSKSLLACCCGVVAATVSLAIGGSIQSAQARMGLREVFILAVCTLPTIGFIGMPVSYFSQKAFARMSSPARPIIFAILGFVISQLVLFLVVSIFLSSQSGNTLDSTISILYLREWRFLTVAFALTGAVIGAVSMYKPNAEQGNAHQSTTAP